MAELSTGDVQRIVNDAANQLRGTIYDLRNFVGGLARDTDDSIRVRNQMENITSRISALQQQMGQLQQQIQFTQQAAVNAQRSAQATVAITQQLNDLKLRFQAIERFAVQMSDYVARVREKEMEDEGYQKANE